MNMGKTLCIIQARLTSTRLPRKVLMDICGKTMLDRVIERVRQSELVHEVVVAAPHDIPCDAPLFIGDEQDVLRRYYDCAVANKATTIVRITSDCPLIDPEVIDYALLYYFRHETPYVIVAPVDGLDVEVFSMELLKEANDNALPEDREHVTTYMRRKTKISVDSLEDLEKVRRVYGLEK